MSQSDVEHGITESDETPETIETPEDVETPEEVVAGSVEAEATPEVDEDAELGAPVMAEAEVVAAARARGPGILADGVAKMRAGLTTVEEVARAVQEDASASAGAA